MQLYLAPLEGITGHIYRNALHDFFGEHIDKYFTPFLEPHRKRAFNSKELKQILPENNQNLNVVPQILTKDADDFLFLADALSEYGYQEINLNLGCPSGTVVGKGRGAAMLYNVTELDHFLDTIFSKAHLKVSIKTRIGMTSPDEFPAILDVYNQYPLEELIIHPRVQKELYTGSPHLEIFQYAVEHSKHRLCYNGDITSTDFYHKITEMFDVNAVMIGRGVLQNPNLFNEIATDNTSSDQHLHQKMVQFHDRLLSDYKEEMNDDRNVLFKMKELWTFWGMGHPEAKKELKEINKAQTITSYQSAIRKLLL